MLQQLNCNPTLDDEHVKCPNLNSMTDDKKSDLHIIKSFREDKPHFN